MTKKGGWQRKKLAQLQRKRSRCNNKKRNMVKFFIRICDVLYNGKPLILEVNMKM